MSIEPGSCRSHMRAAASGRMGYNINDITFSIKPVKVKFKTAELYFASNLSPARSAGALFFTSSPCLSLKAPTIIIIKSITQRKLEQGSTRTENQVMREGCMLLQQLIDFLNFKIIDPNAGLRHFLLRVVNNKVRPALYI